MKRFICGVLIICLFSMTLAHAEESEGHKWAVFGIFMLAGAIIIPLILKAADKSDKEISKKWSAIHLGMTTEQVIKAVGKPNDVNTTIGTWGTHEQWIYNYAPFHYIYFDNDTLTALQN
jgi:ABC-type phosphate transport system permease subunit